MEGPDRRIVYCLRCKRGYDMLPVHLKRACMKNNTPEERDAELKAAKQSQRQWTKIGRRWDYQELCSIIPDETSRQSLVENLNQKGFFVVGESVEDAQGAGPSSQEKVRSEHQHMLEMAQGWMEEACHRLQTGEQLSHHHMTVYRYFCMATLIITHQKPEKTVASFKVTEWNDRQVSAGVGATIVFKESADRAVISIDEDRWFGAYFTNIRPLYLKRQNAAEDDQGCFFLGTTGLPVANPKSDLYRLWKHCQEIGKGASPNPPSGTAGAAGTSSGDQSSVSAKPAFDDKWDAFVTEFPITVGALAPSKEDIVSAGFGDDRTFYYKWRRMQLEMRVQHVSASCGRQRPNEGKVKAIVTKEKWETNVPSFKDVFQAWVSPLKSAVEDNPDILKSVAEQKWKGIDLKDFGLPKGKGLCATMPFSKGDVICDYHGKLISESEGKKKMDELQEGMMCYLFFIKDRQGNKLCVDSQNFPCECHPEKDTFGRRMNHSGKAFNVKPVVFELNFPDGPKNTVLFLATRDIAVNEELCWDYGVRRASFKGEGMNLDWLDD